MLIVSHMYVTLDIVIEKVFIKDCLGLVLKNSSLQLFKNF